jgi:hypothetical protein
MKPSGGGVPDRANPKFSKKINISILVSFEKQ